MVMHYQITDIVIEQVDKSAKIIKDDSTLYSNLKEHIQSHEASVVEPEMIPKLLSRYYISICNTKRVFCIFGRSS
jgi:hypothetical protein